MTTANKTSVGSNFSRLSKANKKMKKALLNDFGKRNELLDFSNTIRAAITPAKNSQNLDTGEKYVGAMFARAGYLSKLNHKYSEMKNKASGKNLQITFSSFLLVLVLTKTRRNGKRR